MFRYFIALAVLWSPAAADPVRIDISAQHVVGVSGIEVVDAGAGFVAVSDAGWFLTGQLQRQDGVLVGGEVTRVEPILGGNGFPVRARRVGDWSDAEGLAFAPDGTMYVSFERWARVARFADRSSPAGFIRDHPDFRTFDDNQQLEAVAIDDAGQIYTLPEKPLPGLGFPLFQLGSDGWIKVDHIPSSNGYAMVGADFGPDGFLYLLERKFVFGTWWQSRLRRFDLVNGATKTLWETQPDDMGNLEGVSVWRDEDGLVATMISDNNARPGVPTEIVELRLTE